MKPEQLTDALAICHDFEVDIHAGRQRGSEEVYVEIDDLVVVIEALRSLAVHRPKAKRYDPMAAPLPFNSTEFLATWIEWCEFRAKRKPALTEMSVKKQLKMLGQCTEDQAITTIEASIRNGWQGLFPEKVQNGTTKVQRDNRHLATLAAGLGARRGDG